MLLFGCSVKAWGLGGWGKSEGISFVSALRRGGCRLVAGLLASREGSVPKTTFECALAILTRTFLRGGGKVEFGRAYVWLPSQPSPGEVSASSAGICTATPSGYHPGTIQVPSGYHPGTTRVPLRAGLGPAPGVLHCINRAHGDGTYITELQNWRFLCARCYLGLLSRWFLYILCIYAFINGHGMGIVSSVSFQSSCFPAAGMCWERLEHLQ